MLPLLPFLRAVTVGWQTRIKVLDVYGMDLDVGRINPTRTGALGR